VTDSSRARLAAKWGRRALLALAPDRVPAGGPAVVRVAGRLVSLDAHPAPVHRLPRTAEERTGEVARWAHSGHLTFGEAELLMALDETTAWEH
jgi:hypothetical protein